MFSSYPSRTRRAHSAPLDNDKDVSLSSLRSFGPLRALIAAKLWLAALSLIMVSGAMLSMGRGLGYLVDKGLGAGDPAILDRAVIATIGIAAILAFGSYLRASLVNQIGNDLLSLISKRRFFLTLSLFIQAGSKQRAQVISSAALIQIPQSCKQC